MTCCLVTDRRRLCPGARSLDEARRALVDQARRAAAARVDLVQVRERDLDARALAVLVAEIVAATRGSGTRVVVNDRLDVALACGADGVHLRADSIPAAAARRLAPRPFVIGRSVHGAAEAAGIDEADYLIAGTVFPTASKGTGAPLLGLDGLAAVVAAARVPVLAIGGITEARIADVLRTGAAGIAAIGLFIDSSERPS